ncbi:hypothetical protein ACFHYQ_17260 [Sphaerimonospora cavernae]|uniref:Uncharacterized protein n=1 Tax=Sphaerimonospora cavernae TaxID=1740611 RepID=A0ABV6U6H3_9ACTN
MHLSLMSELLLLKHAELLQEADNHRLVTKLRRSCAANRAARRAAQRRAGPDSR